MKQKLWGHFLTVYYLQKHFPKIFNTSSSLLSNHLISRRGYCLELSMWFTSKTVIPLCRCLSRPQADHTTSSYFLKVYLCVNCVYLCVETCVCAWAHSDQMMVSGPLELEGKAFVGHRTWVLETELGSSSTAGSAHDCQAISQPQCVSVIILMFSDMNDRNGRDSSIRCKICRSKDPITGRI